MDAAQDVRIARTGPELCHHYFEARSIFTVAYDRWSRSRKNDSTNFESFCSQNSDRTFSPTGKQTLTMFLIYGCESSDAVSDIIQLSTRTKPVSLGTESDRDYEPSSAPSSRLAVRKCKADAMETVKSLAASVIRLTDGLLENMTSSGSQTEASNTGAKRL